MSLTPLHYFKQANQPQYGQGCYQTDCGRFAIVKWLDDDVTINDWRVHGTSHGQWSTWLDNVGLIDMSFATRAELMTVLETMLTADGLMDTGTYSPNGS